MSELYFVVVGSNAVRQAAPLLGVAVTGLIRDAVAEYTMIQTFVNPLPNNYVDAAYTFPVYEGVAVVGFQAEVDGRKIVGKVGEKVVAREEYEEAVKDGKTASLLEQGQGDEFQACIGNIPPKKTICIRITLVSEIKHDGGENQVRFVLPTMVARRRSSSISTGFGFPSYPFSDNFPASKLSVNMACAMSKPITSVQSPSHTIQVYMGTTETVSESIYAFDPNRARVNLTEDSLLDRDLVIIIQALGLDQPRVLVERHPKDQTHAVALTFQPRFALKPLQATELVFLVDVHSRSSFGDPQVKRVGEALELFLRYIPFENHYFNVIGPSSSVFGNTSHQALFPTSVEYNAENLKVAVQYAQTIIRASNLGTSHVIANTFRDVCQRRRRDVPTQIFLLTDGSISNVEELGRAVSNAVDDGERSNQLPLRVFSLGVGDSVSHRLVESVARAGRGYAQLLMASERMEKKVFNMLKAGLTPPVTNTAIQWTDSIVDNFVMVEDADADDDDLARIVNKNVSKPVIDLFSESESTPVVNSDTVAPPPEISATIYQAPFKLPVVYPGARFTAYAILSPTIPLPKELVLRGVSPDGPVQLRVKVESIIEGESTMLHSLAARALVRDFEEACSSIHALGKTLTRYEEQKLKHLGVSIGQREGQGRINSLPLSFNHVAEITKQKLIDIGVTYRLSTKYTSWLAIDEEGHHNDRDVIPAGSCIINVAQTADPRVLQRCAIGNSIASSTWFGQPTPVFTFGEPQGASSGNVFAQQATSSGIYNPFDGQTTSELFGGSTPAFGAQCRPSFSGRTFGATPDAAFGATPAAAFGATPAPAFGATPAAVFGPTPGAAFSATPAPAFGGFHQASSTAAFGATPTSAFGAPQPPAGGVASSSGGFGFGAAQGAPFRASTAQTVASPFPSSTSLFGSAPAPQASSFDSTYLPVQVRWTQQQHVLQAGDQVAGRSSDPHTQLRSLLQHQSFNGLFPLVPAIADLFNTSVDNLRSKLGELRKQCTGLTELAEEQWEAIWATCLAVELMKSKMNELQDEWKPFVEKAERQVESLLMNSEHLARFKAAAKAP